MHFHTPSEVKAAVTGNGNADKAQITAMVTKILALQTKPTPADAADALALAICHCWRAPMIARMAAAPALADGDVTALTRVPGIGKRGAERMVLELRDKIGPVHAAAGAVALNGHSVRGPVVEALIGLGFALKQAEEATDKVLANEPEATTSGALRSALSMLGKK